MTDHPVLSLAAAPSSTNSLFQALQDAVSTGPSSESVLWFWVGAAGVAVAIGVCIGYATRRDAPRTRPQHDYLTLAVDVLGLSEEDRRELLRVARAARLEHPASMLLAPTNLAHALAAARLADDSGARAQRFDRLCQTLFGEPCPAASGPATSPPPVQAGAATTHPART